MPRSGAAPRHASPGHPSPECTAAERTAPAPAAPPTASPPRRPRDGGRTEPATSDGTASSARRTLSRVARWSRSDHAFKTGLASGLAWAAGSALPGITRPYFAPLAAILTVQLTVAETVSRGVQRTIGVVTGVVVAMALAHAVGLGAWGIGFLVFASLTVGSWLRLGPLGVSQVAVSGLLVVIVGSLGGPGYAWQRIVETAVGALVGIGVNLALVPPSGLPAAARALDALAAELVAVLDELADDVRGGLPPAGSDRALGRARGLAARAAEVRHSLLNAEEILRYNFRGRRERPRLGTLQRAAEALGRSADQVRGIARVMHDAGGTGWPAAAPLPGACIERVLRTASAVVGAYWRCVEGECEREGEGAGSPGGWGEGLDAALREQRSATAALHGPEGWVPLGDLLATAHRLVADLEEARHRSAAPPPAVDGGA